jgi:hypothetical protein
MAVSQGWRPSCARIGALFAELLLGMEARGVSRPQVVAMTGTLPLAFEAEVIRRLRLEVRLDDVVRGAVDRERIVFARSFLPELSPSETNARYTLRAWLALRVEAPASALVGHKILYLTKATVATTVAAFFEASGVPAVAYATNDMSDAERAAALARWKADATVVLIASAAFGQGINMPTVSLVVQVGPACARCWRCCWLAEPLKLHAYVIARRTTPLLASTVLCVSLLAAQVGFASDVLEWFQKNGRIRVEGFAVTILRARHLVERLGLPCDSDAQLQTNLCGVLQLLEVLMSPQCLRRAAVEWLGGSVMRCRGCDVCLAFRARHCSGQGGCCGSYPHLLKTEPAAAAARVLLAALGTEARLLSSVLAAIPDTAVSPFDESIAHQQLVLSLVASRHLELRVSRGSYGGTIVMASASRHALDAFAFRSEVRGGGVDRSGEGGCGLVLATAQLAVSSCRMRGGRR